MRVALVIHSLGCGGAERVLASLAGMLARGGDEVLVLSMESAEGDFYPLPQGTERRSIGPLPGGVLKAWNNVTRIKRLRRILIEADPDLVVAFQGIENVRTLLALRKSNVPVIVTEHVDPRYHRPPLPWVLARRLTYGSALCLVSVSRGVDECFRWLEPKKRAVIPNPLPDGLERQAEELPSWEPPGGRRVLASMGRLAREKGMDLLIRAFASLAADHPEWDLLILGEGEERDALEKLVATLGLPERVHMPGIFSNPFPTLRRCHAFALASRYEGFGNVIVEAMAVGLPVIVTDCPSGPAEIVQHESNGLLAPVNDVPALARGLRRLLGDAALRRRLAEAGQESSKDYRSEAISARWLKLIGRQRTEQPLASDSS